MRLVNINTGSFRYFPTRKKPRYAVLSHRWTKDEVAFSDIHPGNFINAQSHIKFRGTIQQAKRDGLEYVWIDTCCIDTQSSAEVSEAINSMYQWYQGAEYCYVYLHDIDESTWRESFHKSKWFTRGWTLQELLAPPLVIFYDRKWRPLGDRKSLATEISRFTGIDLAALETGTLSGYSIAEKMSWAATRITTRLEDSAYCLMGLFGVNMPLLYGEGKRAFLRLQEEIIKDNDDQSIFAWSMGKKRFSGLLAPMSTYFAGSKEMITAVSPQDRAPFAVTNRGLAIKLKITPWSADTYLAYLDCTKKTTPTSQVKVGIFLRRLTEDDQYIRVNLPRKGLWLGTDWGHFRDERPTRERQLFVRKTFDLTQERYCLKDRVYGFKISDGWLPASASISVAFASSHKRFAILKPGRWGCAMMIDVSAEHKGLRKIALGFDFDFHPVCLLEDSFTEVQRLNGEQMSLDDWSAILSDDFDWDEIHEGSRVYRRNNHTGIWALKGHRLWGLDVLLSESFSDRGSLLTLKRDENRSRLVWELHIDNLVGPFRNHQHKAFEDIYGDRRNFQAAFGLDMTPEDLDEGDSILKAMFDPIQQESRSAEGGGRA